MNKSYDQRIEEERKQARRSWQGILLIFVFIALSMAGAAFIGSGMLNEWFMVPFMIILAVGLVLIMGASIYWLAMSGQQKLERSKEVSERLQPDMPVEEEEEEEESVAKFIFLEIIPGTLLFLALYWFLLKVIEDALERVWPDVPLMVSPIIVSSILGTIVWLMMSVGLKPLLPQKEEGKPVPWKGALFMMAQLWFPTFLIIFSFGGLPWLIKTYDLPTWIGILGFFLSGTIFFLLFASPFSILEWWIWRAAKEGDYEQALSRLRSVEEFKYKDNKLLTLEGRLLFLAGRNEEAQELFSQKKYYKIQVVRNLDSDSLNDFAPVLLGQARYEEATLVLEDSITIKANQLLAYSRLAEVYLHQGKNFSEARKLTERALQNHEEGSLLLRWTGKADLVETLAIHAWVLAELGLHHEAAQALERAFAAAPRNHKPLLAALHLRAGYVSFRRGDGHQAKQHFTTGQQLDPTGHYGRLASVALAKM